VKIKSPLGRKNGGIYQKKEPNQISPGLSSHKKIEVGVWQRRSLPLDKILKVSQEVINGS